MSGLPIDPGDDLATAVELRQLTTFLGSTPAYLLVEEVAPSSICPISFIRCCAPPFGTQASAFVNARTLIPKSFDLDGKRPFVPVLSEKVRARRGRPPKDEVLQAPLTDISYVRQMASWMVTTRLRLTDETMRNCLKQAVRRAEDDGAHFSIPVTPHTLRHSYITVSPGK